MLNRLDTAVVRARRQVEYLRLLEGASKGHGTVYHPVSHRIAGYNFGSRVRPDVAPIAVNASGFETVASFLARGGRITVGRAKTAKGALLVDTIKISTKRGHNRTGQIVRRTVRPSTMCTSSVVSLAREERPYNGTAMKMFGPRG
jgi:hypothetical protein